MSISLELLFSSLWVTHPEGMGFDSIMIAPILLALRGFFFVFECGVSSFPSYQLSVASSLSLNVGYLLFLVGSGILLSMAVQQLVAMLVLLQEEMGVRPLTPLS